jgi:hypothetical protein
MGLFDFFDPEPEETDFNDTGFAPMAPEQVEDLRNSAQGYAPGYNLGSLATNNAIDWSAGQSGARPDQSNLERAAEQRGNFLYGGSSGGIDDFTETARANMQPWATGFGAMGTGFYDASQGASGRGPHLYGQGIQDHRADGAFARTAAQDLYNRAQQGPGPSAAQAQLNASTAAGMRQQLALAGSGRGAGGGASAMRNAAANQAVMQGSANANAATLRANEEATWRQQQAAMLGQASALAQQQQAQDLALSGYVTGARQQQDQLNDQLALGYGQLALGAGQAGAQTQMGTEQLVHGANMGAMSGGMGYEQLLSQIYGINKGAQMQQAQANQAEKAADMSFWGTVLATGAQTSDIRAKKDIKPAEDEVTSMLRRLGVEQDHETTHQPTMAEQYAKRTGRGTPISDNSYGLLGFDSESGLYRGSTQKEDQAGQAWRSELEPPPVPTARFADTDATDTVRETSASSYLYKNPERHGEGRFVGPMAQELERTPAGKSLVSTQPDGTKAVDGGRAGLLALSAAGTQQRQQDDFAQRMAAADAKIARLEAMLGEDDEKKRKRAGFDVDLSSPDYESLDESARRERSYTP